jgi:hypothetical protein
MLTGVPSAATRRGALAVGLLPQLIRQMLLIDFGMGAIVKACASPRGSGCGAYVVEIPN